MTWPYTTRNERKAIAVIGTGISGLSAAWLLAKGHDVTVYEADDRIGGHSNTVEIDIAGRSIAVDTGFIVYNEPCYPNLSALFAHLGVETAATDMSFAVSIDRGRLEYAGSDLAGLFAQPTNLLKPRFWSMMSDLLRFYREAPRDLATMGDVSLADWLDAHRYGRAFREDHLYPMAAAIWSTPSAEVGDYPAAAFVRFCENHGLLRLTGRPVWRTVKGGSREYVARLTASFRDRILTSTPVVSVRRDAAGVEVVDATGARRRFDDVVIATHADRALGLLADASAEERRLLAAFHYSRNEAVLHSDARLMPQRRAAWASWNYLSDARDGDRALSVTYWMNRLQSLGETRELFVTLNPLREPDPALVHTRIAYDHPLFDAATGRAQPELWSLQGVNRTWFCGAHFGAGFHEDGLQAGLAVAEDLGGRRRPWTVANDSARIHRLPLDPRSDTREAAE
ncbi:NAD(P)/FAD-dependent oxidoreductase [Pinisolibacter aquiterrae]|uniref:NAD(P)/FAD-dependent oxidoreductase n=1 Tax=Pinisolibacter aquiterrae TaxID=2815579 RepID=UPI001C3C8426|nr:NAD(P)/FAD-dependent oxidoreductase [Pinisolibacter aquiterrae]MBV5263851.1 NAD(P)/FAD-dependent oxidoreductase [Pinisolibacter aquiterrae]MCC8237244.1 NAD(P)/FAD-dependent oxidoreductase [Pinisolibacter aquiterrae]